MEEKKPKNVYEFESADKAKPEYKFESEEEKKPKFEFESDPTIKNKTEERVPFLSERPSKVDWERFTSLPFGAAIRIPSPAQRKSGKPSVTLRGEQLLGPDLRYEHTYGADNIHDLIADAHEIAWELERAIADGSLVRPAWCKTKGREKVIRFPERRCGRGPKRGGGYQD